ncbi:hypothetical protein B2G52_08795 [Neisseria lactamica]|uniref:Uncharacterized protein n=1 Tax=Neisseria lactamica TaxID=486 RepID=A0AAU8VH86_NEILA|nr:hypothetical protein B2G52_08795 [Neisseria lactamica]
MIGKVHRISFSVETPPLGHLSFGAVESDFIWEGCNPFRIRTTHRVTLYVSSCVLKHISVCRDFLSGWK